MSNLSITGSQELNFVPTKATETRRLRRKIDHLRVERAVAKNAIKIMEGIIAILFIALVTSISVATVKINNLKEELVSVKEASEAVLTDYEAIKSEAAYIGNYINNEADVIYEVTSLASELDKELDTLKKDNLQIVDENKKLLGQMKVYEERVELFDKYDYAILREDNTRTDITYEDLKNLEQLVQEKNMTSDMTDLILSIAMTESGGFEDVKNSSSTAVGFGQFLSGTGKFVYTKLMGNSTYDHNKVASDGSTNLVMMVEYLDYLGNKYNGNLEKVMDEYRGCHSPSYATKVNSFLYINKGINLSQIVMYNN